MAPTDLKWDLNFKKIDWLLDPARDMLSASPAATKFSIELPEDLSLGIKSCDCGRIHPQLIGKDDKGNVRTSPAAALPDEFNRAVAELIYQDHKITRDGADAMGEYEKPHSLRIRKSKNTRLLGIPKRELQT